jgi:hypothetical protein
MSFNPTDRIYIEAIRLNYSRFKQKLKCVLIPILIIKKRLHDKLFDKAIDAVHRPYSLYYLRDIR